MVFNKIVIFFSGTMRSDCIFPVGKFRMRDLSSILPIMDELLLIECTGKFHVLLRHVLLSHVLLRHVLLRHVLLSHVL